MNEFIKLTPEQEKTRDRRSIWIALAVGGFMLLVFFITVAKMQAHMPAPGP